MFCVPPGQAGTAPSSRSTTTLSTALGTWASGGEVAASPPSTKGGPSLSLIILVLHKENKPVGDDAVEGVAAPPELLSENGSSSDVDESARLILAKVGGRSDFSISFLQSTILYL
mmetsp:Transcript_5645/g.14102  ORF Transcript_5645/g.14102 Transcript_5645/m.14102 type:complete len:115 (-) Transcript_5645:557-901(-)